MHQTIVLFIITICYLKTLDFVIHFWVQRNSKIEKNIQIENHLNWTYIQNTKYYIRLWCHGGHMIWLNSNSIMIGWCQHLIDEVETNSWNYSYNYIWFGSMNTYALMFMLFEWMNFIIIRLNMRLNVN